MDATESTLVPGYRLDRYELLCPIASGGMASVWLARLRGKRGFEKLFAIKTIKTELISDSHFQEMFLDEARIASRIVHPNVAQILELGEQDDILYIVMEWVDGDSLAKVNRLAMKRGSALPPGVSMRIIADACAGLHAAHQLKDAEGESLGVVHRDVSPQNILLSTVGNAKVIDFGLVKARGRSAGPTETGVVKGKIRYMAPEQVGGLAMDHRADIWAAGMCLYELVTGHIPYDGEDDVAVVKRLLSANPLPAFNLALPPQIEKILMKALVKDPVGRFETASAMRRAIEQAINELELPAESDDVAEFVKETLPELAAKRTKTIAKAVQAADARDPSPGSLEGLGPGDMAFAATEISNRGGFDDDATLKLTRRRKEPTEAEDISSEPTRPLESDGGRSASSYGASRTTSAATLREQLGERRKRNGTWLWVAAAVVVGTGSWILWPRPGAPGAQPVTATTTSPTASATPSAPPAVPSSPTTASGSSTIELDSQGKEDASSSIGAVRPSSLPDAPKIHPSPRTKVDTPPPARTYNPAWSILTNPPEAGVFAPAPSPARTEEPPASE